MNLSDIKYDKKSVHTSNTSYIKVTLVSCMCKLFQGTKIINIKYTSCLALGIVKTREI